MLKKSAFMSAMFLMNQNSVAEYTIMMILLCLRHYKASLWRTNVNDFSLEGLQGRQIKDLTVGILGTGRIGRMVLQYLASFGCKLLAYNSAKMKM